MARTLDGDVVILDITSGRYFSINDVGALIWDRLEVDTDRDTLVSAVTATYRDLRCRQRDRSGRHRCTAGAAHRGRAHLRSLMTSNDYAPLTSAPPTSPLYRVLADSVGVRITRLLLRTIGFQRTIMFLGAIPPTLNAAEYANPMWAREVAFVSKWRYSASCLDRSVFLWFIMRQHSLTGDLRIGIATSHDVIDGHAWVEHDGRVLNDRLDIADDFVVFEENPVGIVFQ